ncbi:hypothetical protein BDY19DRAFT_47709 [Irpex rosettiformis]|uniref:Uncharacterized protein n=1 Tax=Irpex rosettiformis TaxID=378272 RepID=A0ACB8UKT3_9APHY|nr:hypothetical protein BDY19DRAFT_47709 [Irpex rosettiformis]
MSEDTLPIVVMVLGFTGIVLLGALLVTPTPKHAIVNSFLVTTLARSIFCVIPPIIFEASPAKITNLPQNSMLQAFCAADAIIVRYLTIAMTAFGISFTLPLLYMCCKRSAHNPGYTGPSPDGRFYTLSHAGFTFGPFAWALPTILASLPQLKRDISAVNPQFLLAICIIEDSTSNTLALALMLSALAFSTVIAITLAFYLFRTVRLPLQTHCLGRFNVTQLLRFALLLCIYIVSIVLDSILSARWIHWSRHDRDRTSSAQTIFKISVVWQSITPILYFFIFAAHEEVFSVWRGWSRGWYRMQISSQWPNVKQQSLEAGSISEEDHRRRTWLKSTKPSRSSSIDHSRLSSILGHPNSHPAEQTARSIIPQRILLKPMLYHTTTSNSNVQAPTQCDPLGLSPAPRPIGNRSTTSPEEASSSMRHPLVTMPSLTALGTTNSVKNTFGAYNADVHLTESESSLQSTGTLSSRLSAAADAEYDDTDSESWISS